MPHLLLRLLGGAALALFCGALGASQGDTRSAHLRQLQLNLLGSLGDFYLLYGIDADPALGRSIAHHLELAELQLSQIEVAVPGAAAALVGLRQQWRAYRQLLTALSREAQRQTTLEGRAFTELIQLNEQLLAACATLQSASPPGPDPTAGDDGLELQLQRLATSYIAYNIGANSLAGDGTEIDRMAVQVDAGLAALLARPAQDEEQRRLQETIRSKWRYIEPALRHYQKSAVPSLVRHYSARIIADLERLQSGTR
ncbi:hypothetical protein D3880_22410 [Pseudomonas cavernae]|uniref:Uncharacterized protein n=1 Tax=Pseudomonas cavernae TaxID=2320867 RepID=A0A385ZAH6_9PSED|nr:hypothetical protein [Pseudomonas cavernae]AYC34952.1 hypothetical protein D3880_22410 [Pseudomonas cavernae]